MSSHSSPSGLPRRRNGRQQACEPCRIAKIACDHTLPICSRCRRRKVAGKCIYVEAPMTRTSTQVRGSSLTVASARHRVASSVAFNVTPPVSNSSASLTHPSISSQSPSSAHSPTRQGNRAEVHSSGPPPAKSNGGSGGGFFGPTSFSAVFMENGANFAPDADEIHIPDDDAKTPLPAESLQLQTFLTLGGSCDNGWTPRVALGAKVLRALPDKQTFSFLIQRYHDACNESTFIKHSVMSCVASVWATYGSALKEPRKKEKLEQVSEILVKNSTTALQEHGGPDDYTKWLESFSGENMRWETVGIMLACMTRATLSLPERDSFFTTQKGARRDRMSFALEMKDCVQACVTLSNYKDLINFPMMVLLMKNLILQAIISGDTCLAVWRQLGDLVSASTALGLHRQLDAGQPTSFLGELRKRLFVKIFAADKGSAALTGRPPFLSYRYTRFQEPLDLSEEVIMSGGEELAIAIKRLDANGWNTEGKIYAATKARTHFRLGIVLGETLELTLGNPKDRTEERIRYLLERLEETYNEFPSFLQFSPSDPRIKTYSDQHFLKTLIIRLYMLDGRLILERLAHKCEILDGQSLVDCAREILELTVIIWVQRDRFVAEQHNFDCLLMCWGVPAAGVLCVELLKQLKHPEITSPHLARSEIVQNLSLLIGFFEWVRPAAGNYRLCVRMKLIIKRILDQILDPSPPSTQMTAVPASAQNSVADSTVFPDVPSSQNFMSNGIMGPWDTAVSPPYAFDEANYEDKLDNLDWLDNVDWSRGSLVDLCGQDYSTMAWNYAL